MTQSTAHAVAKFVIDALANPPQPPPRAPKPVKSPSRRSGIWSILETPEERSAYARQLAAKRNPKNMARPHRAHTKVPNGWTGYAAVAATEAARKEATELLAELKASGAIAASDSEGEAATLEALTIIRSPGGKQQRRKYALRLLRRLHPQLASLLA